MTDLTDNYKEVKLELEVKLQSFDEEVERWKTRCQTLETQLKEVSCLIKLVFDLETKGRQFYFAKKLFQNIVYYYYYLSSEWLTLTHFVSLYRV